MNTQSVLPQVAQANVSSAYPTAEDIVLVPLERRGNGGGGFEDRKTVLCRGVEIGRLVTSHNRTSEKPPRYYAVRSTCRYVGGQPQQTVPDHDVEWLLREHIDHDLGGRSQRLASVIPGRTFSVPSNLILDPRDLGNGTTFFVPMFTRLTVITTDAERITFRWDVRYAPTDLLPRRDFVHGKVESLPRSKFEHLVAERLLTLF